MSKNEVATIDDKTKAFRQILASDGFDRLIKMVLDATPNEVLGAELTSMFKESLK
jgi:hypothetical protein